MNPDINIRLATERDLDELVRLERAAFQKDLFTEDQIDYLLTHSRATVFVLEHNSAVAGSAYVLWRKSHEAARLYNLAVDPAFQGKGLGYLLMQECELESARRGCAKMTLEVRQDNLNAIKFYEKLGYSVTRHMADYYEDGTTGLKMSRDLNQQIPRELRLNIPYHAQTLDFTCGPASLMMVLKYFYPDVDLTRTLEMRIWKEATLVYMLSGMGGADAYGLALSTIKRGIGCHVIISMDTTPMLKTVRIPKKREIMRIVHGDLKHRARRAGVTRAIYEYDIDEIIAALYRGLVPVVLISTYRLTGDQLPHWVVVTGFDANNVYIHDPDVESYKRNKFRARHLKIEKSEFLRMSRYGKEVFRCLLLLGPASEYDESRAQYGRGLG